MRKLFAWLRGHDIKGRLLATILAASSRDFVWPLYAWLRQRWVSLGYVPQLTWLVGALYFAVWVLVMALLLNEFKKYRLMVHDAAFGGALIATAAALHSQPIQQDLSRAGLGLAPWIVFLASALLVISRIPNLGGRDRE